MRLIPSLLALSLLLTTGPKEVLGFLQSVNGSSEDGNLPQGKIVGGVAASSSSTFPFAVSLYTGSSHLLACGAAILSDSWVVTAAHCLIDVNTVVGSSIYARREVSSITLGVGSLSNITASPKTLRAAIIHPQYDAVNQTNDIALLQLSSPLTFSSAIQPIRVDMSSDIPSGTNVTALGWGATETENRSSVLRSVSLSTTQGSRCTSAYPDYSASAGNLICIGGTQGKDTCYGDSGGPLVTDLPRGAPGGTQVPQGLVGLTSFAINKVNLQSDDCGLKDTVAFYTHVAKYASWIGATSGIPVNDFSVSSSSSAASTLATSSFLYGGSTSLSLPGAPSWITLSLLILTSGWGLGGN